MSGKLLWTSGHVHDGGTYQVLYVNGRPVCNSTQFYARNIDFAHSMHNGANPMNNNGPQPNYNQPNYGPNGPQAYNGPNAQPQGYYGPYAQTYPVPQGAYGPNMPQSNNMPSQGNVYPQQYNGPNVLPPQPQASSYPQQNNGPIALPQQPQASSYPQQNNGPIALPQQPQANSYPQQNNGPIALPQQPQANSYPQQYNGPIAMQPQPNVYPQQYNDPNARPLQYNYKRQHGGAFGGDHIESPGACTDFGDIRKGDAMTTKAFYDMFAHKGMTHKGEEEKVMGNMRVFIGPVD